VKSGTVAVLSRFTRQTDGGRLAKFYTWPDLVADVFSLKNKPIDIALEDYLCLRGVPGCKGAEQVGRVTSRALLAKYGDLEGIRAAWPNLSIPPDNKPLRRIQIDGLRDMFDRLSIIRNVVLFRRDVPLPPIDLTTPDLKKFRKSDGASGAGVNGGQTKPGKNS